MSRLGLLTLCSSLIALVIFFSRKERKTIPAGEGLMINKEWLKSTKSPVTPEEFVRPADQTFLTFPEWYLVFSPEEQASYFKNKTATSFPFMSHTAQIWESYRIVNDQIKDNFPYNAGYHFMIWVIGTSASVEYTIKAWYETVVGRITDTKNVVTEEDQFNATFTQDYVDFIKDRPWYEFDFKSRLISLWSHPLLGDINARKIERRYVLTSELLMKYLYGKLIGLGTQTVYDAALPTTEVLVGTLPSERTDYKVIAEYPDKSALISLPRYDKFNAAICELARKGVSFREIAGNTSAILITILAPSDSKTDFNKARIIFRQPIASNPAVTRVALATQVKDLQQLIVQLEDAHVNIEHIFDF